MLQRGSSACPCPAPAQPTRLVAVTGGPGAGKTAVLQMARRAFCRHVALLPEAASVIFGGGFPREHNLSGRRAAQRAIFYVQRETETLADGEPEVAVALCDRGTVDGAAYWPGEPRTLFESVGTNLEAEIARYALVIHLETPTKELGYNHVNPLRIETAAQARAIDERIKTMWESHPNRHVIPSGPDFMMKAERAIELILGELPECCARGRSARIGE